MSRRVFKWVSDLIKTKPDQTTIRAMSVIGYSVIERYQNGRIQNDKLLFTAQDKFQLRSKLKSEFGLDPFFTTQLPDDRLDIAKLHHNEKIARLPPSHDHILMALCEIQWVIEFQLTARGVAIFAKACFGHPSPSKRQKLNATAMPSAPRFVLVTTSRPNRGPEHWLQMT